MRAAALGTTNKVGLKGILVTDCGSTTTKARFFKKKGDEYRFICAGEAPTTVEEPYEDVTLGVLNSAREVEELTVSEIIAENQVGISSKQDGKGVDLYLTTSSAGGGLQMSVLGVAKSMTAESAQRAALGAGAIVLDVLTADDGVPAHEKIERTRQLRPDMVLLAGGTDGGAVTPVLLLSEILRTADPSPRFGADFQLPVIYAGNINVRDQIEENLASKFALKPIDNIRPTVDRENMDAATAAIQELFMEHVMSHAPGYDRLKSWTPHPIMPTPMAEGLMFRLLAKMRKANVIGVGLGGATTNVYSIYDEKFVRTVSANLGMSYSIGNVLKEAGLDNIIRWVPFDIDRGDLVDSLTNKMIRPTTIPQTLRELMIEHAVAREALRLGLMQHRLLARGLRGVMRFRTIADTFERRLDLESYIKMLHVDIIGGTGGLLSHAPREIQSAMMLIDGFGAEGVTKLIKDSVFMFPHLGILSTVYPEIAYEVFEKDALVKLGTCVAPVGEAVDGEMASIELIMPNGETKVESVTGGEIRRIAVPADTKVVATIKPARKCDLGLGIGKTLKTEVEGGVAGVILDGRGRPLVLPQNTEERKEKLLQWYKSLAMYPTEALEKLSENA
jgi:uncharacterized protein (TIGR01319 family)